MGLTREFKLNHFLCINILEFVAVLFLAVPLKGCGSGTRPLPFSLSESIPECHCLCVYGCGCGVWGVECSVVYGCGVWDVWGHELKFDAIDQIALNN